MITLKTLPQATAQEVFDQVALHLLTQMKRSTTDTVNRGTLCRYRGEGGLKCAAGCLIGDDEYDVSLEGRAWGTLSEDRYVPKVHVGLIQELQFIHDNFPPEGWLNELQETAQQEKLEFKYENMASALV